MQRRYSEGRLGLAASHADVERTGRASDPSAAPFCQVQSTVLYRTLSYRINPQRLAVHDPVDQADLQYWEQEAAGEDAGEEHAERWWKPQSHHLQRAIDGPLQYYQNYIIIDERYYQFIWTIDQRDNGMIMNGL